MSPTLRKLYRWAADTLTISRLILGVAFPVIGLVFGEAATAMVIFAIILGRTMDVIDGILGRL